MSVTLNVKLSADGGVLVVFDDAYTLRLGRQEALTLADQLTIAAEHADRNAA